MSGCLPESGGCERHRTDPFVNHLNSLERVQFAHEACLDVLHRGSPQPEALYRDRRTGDAIVLERKSLVWPLDYAARHRNYHTVAEALSEQFRDFARELPISIHISLADRIPRGELTVLPGRIAQAVIAAGDSLRLGQGTGAAEAHVKWWCHPDPDERIASQEPSTGLIVRWEEPDVIIPSYPLPSPLVGEIQRHMDAVAQKFSSYPSARGILLLDPHGAIRYTDKSWWSRAFQSTPVPPEIAEVWLSSMDWVTDTERGWSFERVHP